MNVPVRRMVLILLIAAIMTGCAEVDTGKELAPREVRLQIPNQVFDDVTLRQTNDGSVSFVLKAPKLYRWDKRNQAVLKGGIQVDFYKDNRVASFLTADSGEVLAGGKELYARGNVVVETDSGTVIKSPRLFWMKVDGLIRSDTTVVVYTKWDTLRGKGLIATQDLKNRKILQPEGISWRSKKEESDDTTKTD